MEAKPTGFSQYMTGKLSMNLCPMKDLPFITMADINLPRWEILKPAPGWAQAFHINQA